MGNSDVTPSAVARSVHKDDEDVRPLATELDELSDETTNELLSYVEERDEDDFVETIVESLSNEIKQINWGEEQPSENAEELELGPNNCQIANRVGLRL
jgi:hypothetical protein